MTGMMTTGTTTIGMMTGTINPRVRLTEILEALAARVQTGAAKAFAITLADMENSAIIDAVERDRVDEVRELIEEYLEWMISTHPEPDKVREVLASQGTDSELANLTGHYERIWLATVDDAPAGCIMYKPLSETTAEFKRLYVRPTGRGHGFGRRLVEITIGAIKEAGYKEVVLDSDPELATAIAMYERMGFEYIKPYNDNPAQDAVFMRMKL